jgi:hypothetical protein
MISLRALESDIYMRGSTIPAIGNFDAVADECAKDAAGDSRPRGLAISRSCRYAAIGSGTDDE